MSLTSAMMVGFTGITANQTTVDTVGHNIANANTTAFKVDRALFETLMYRTVHEGSAPTSESGGTLPYQTGSGVGVAASQSDFGQGSIQPTGFQSDLAIDGEGFFVLESSKGEQVYSRAGAFSLDAIQTMVALNGDALQVFAADADGNISTDSLTNLVIPLGTASAAIATSEVVMDGQLDAGADPAATGAVLESQALVTAAGNAATGTTALADLVDENGVSLFAAGDTLTINARKGPAGALPAETFVVGTDGSTLDDLATYLTQVFRIDIDPTTGPGAGVTVTDGKLVVTSNPGDVNALELSSSAIQNTGSLAGSPFSFTQTMAASGEGTSTSFEAYDSLGNSVGVRLRAVMESRGPTGTTWRYYAESKGEALPAQLLGTGTISFDANGQFVAATNNTLSLDRSAAGATSPLTFTLDFSGLTAVASPDGESELLMASSDGKPAGVMTGYQISADGIVTATYDNTMTEVLGQVALATFTNPEGLVAKSENRFQEGPNSGDATLVAPQEANAGALRTHALEESNVEITREFINLIKAQTGVTAASRVVRTADQMLQQLLLLAR